MYLFVLVKVKRKILSGQKKVLHYRTVLLISSSIKHEMVYVREYLSENDILAQTFFD